MNNLKCFTLLCFTSLVLFTTTNSRAQLTKENQASLNIKGTSQIIIDEKNNSVSFVKLDEQTLVPSGDAVKWLKDNILGASEKLSEFRLLKEKSDKLGFTHARYKQFYKDIPLEDAIYIVHSKNGRIVSANGLAYKDISVQVQPA